MMPLASSRNVLAVGTRCRHGFPQAFVWDALKRPAAYDGNAASRGGAKQRAKERAAAGEHNRKIALDSGLFRLSCPLLVKAADEWEAEGAVVNLNAEVSRSPPLAAALDGVNRDHANARRVLLGPRLAFEATVGPRSDFETTSTAISAHLLQQSSHSTLNYCHEKCAMWRL